MQTAGPGAFDIYEKEPKTSIHLLATYAYGVFSNNRLLRKPPKPRWLFYRNELFVDSVCERRCGRASLSSRYIDFFCEEAYLISYRTLKSDREYNFHALCA